MQRQPDAERRAPAGVAFQFDPAAVRADDALHNHQTQSGALFFGREKRLKNAVDLFLRNAAAGVGHAHPDAVRAFAGLQRQRAALGHRLHRVFDEIHQNLLHLRRVHRRRRQLARQFCFHVQAAIVQFRLKQIQGFFNHVVQGSRFQLRRRGTNRLQKLRDDVIQPVDFALGHVEVLLQFAGMSTGRIPGRTGDAGVNPFSHRATRHS